MEHTLTIFEGNKKVVKNYSDFIEAGIAKKEKLEQEGIRVVGCDKCQQQFSQQDKETKNYLIEYGYAEVDWKDPTKPEETYFVRKIKHKTCPQ